MVEKGDIGFGIQKKTAIQNIMLREEVENYHLEMLSSEGSEEPLIGEVASVASDTLLVGSGLPEIHINDAGDKEEGEERKSRKNSLLVSCFLLNNKKILNRIRSRLQRLPVMKTISRRDVLLNCLKKLMKI